MFGFSHSLRFHLFYFAKQKKNFLSIFFRRKFAHKSDWSAVKSTCPSEFFFFLRKQKLKKVQERKLTLSIGFQSKNLIAFAEERILDILVPFNRH
jgi:hypothetical protein